MGQTENELAEDDKKANQHVTIVDLEVEKLKCLTDLEAAKKRAEEKYKEACIEHSENKYELEMEDRRLKRQIDWLKSIIGIYKLPNEKENDIPEENDISEEEKMQQIRTTIANGILDKELTDLIDSLKLETFVRYYDELKEHIPAPFFLVELNMREIQESPEEVAEPLGPEFDEFLKQNVDLIDIDDDIQAIVYLIARMNSDQEKLRLYYRFDLKLQGKEYDDKTKDFPEFLYPSDFAIIVASLRDEDLKIRAIEQMKKYYQTKMRESDDQSFKIECEEWIAKCAGTLRTPSDMMKFYREVEESYWKIYILSAVSRLPEYQRALTAEEMQEVNIRINQEVVVQQKANDAMRRKEQESTLLTSLQMLIGLKREYIDLVKGQSAELV